MCCLCSPPIPPGSSALATARAPLPRARTRTWVLDEELNVRETLWPAALCTPANGNKEEPIMPLVPLRP